MADLGLVVLRCLYAAEGPREEGHAPQAHGHALHGHVPHGHVRLGHVSHGHRPGGDNVGEEMERSWADCRSASSPYARLAA
eukprot:108152-Rhodomonas_salina.1